MVYLNKNDFLKENAEMQLADINIEPNSVHIKDIMYNTNEVLEWDPAKFMTSYEKWFAGNEKIKDSDCYGHATISVYEKIKYMLQNLN